MKSLESSVKNLHADHNVNVKYVATGVAVENRLYQRNMHAVYVYLNAVLFGV